MKYLYLKSTDPYYNLAVEEYLFRTCDDDVFMLWQNEPSVIIGKNQNAYAEVDLAAAESRGVHICRRITGGGAVYHDLGNLNYSFISTRGGGRALDFEYFTRPIRFALAGFGLTPSLGGRNDLELDGRKFSGNAQHSEGERILHHGTLLFDTDSEAMSSVLRVDREKLEHRGIRSVGARVVNLCELLPESVTLSDFLLHIEREVCSELGTSEMTPPEGDGVLELVKRNMSPEWIFSEKRFLTEYSVRRKRKYPFGLIDLRMELDRGVISSILISGDFFGKRPVEELEAILTGQPCQKIARIDPSPYIDGMSFSDLCELLG